MNIARIIENTLVPYVGYQLARQGLDQCLKYACESPEPVCLAIIGESRTGKTRSIEEFRMENLSARGDAGTSMPIVYLHAPSKPRVKSLAETILECLGDPKPSAGTETNMTLRIHKLMRAAGTRMLIIDEFQHFQDKGTKKIMWDVTDWLKILVERTRVALVVSGLPGSMAVINTNEQLRGRFHSPIELRRFDWRDSHSRAMFIAVMDSFCDSMKQHFQLPEFGTDEMAFRFYCASGGLIGYVTRLLRQVVWNAVDKGDSIIVMKDFERANQTVIWSSAEVQDITNPFSRHFISIPSDTLLARIRKIGTRNFGPDDQATFQRSICTKKQKSGAKLSDILVP